MHICKGIIHIGLRLMHACTNQVVILPATSPTTWSGTFGGAMRAPIEVFQAFEKTLERHSTCHRSPEHRFQLTPKERRWPFPETASAL